MPAKQRLFRSDARAKLSVAGELPEPARHEREGVEP